jgi:hypothetical protein
MTTTVTVRPTPDAAETIAAQVGHAIRRFGKPRQEYPKPTVSYEHHQLFREPVYTDGQPYKGDEDDDPDDGEGW